MTFHGYFINIFIIIGITLILALSLQLAIGYTGLINLGHVAFYAIGAYTSALLALNGFPFLISFIFAGIVAMIFGFLLSIPTNRLKGDYLAVATLGFTFVIFSLTLNLTQLTRGPLGLAGIPKPNILGISFASNFDYLFLVFIITILSYFIIKKIVDSPFGKVLEATRDDELYTRILGKNTFKIKSISLAVSAFFAGIAGSLFAHYITFIEPNSFTFLELIPLLSIVIIAGLSSLKGTVIATFVLLLIPEALRFIGFPSSIIGPSRLIIYSLILLIILINKPRGFFGKVELT